MCKLKTSWDVALLAADNECYKPHERQSGDEGQYKALIRGQHLGARQRCVVVYISTDAERAKARFRRASIMAELGE